MTRATGGSAWAATSTRSRFFPYAYSRASSVVLIPSCAVLADQPHPRDADRIVIRSGLGTARRFDPEPLRGLNVLTKLVLTSPSTKNRWHAAAEDLDNPG